MKRSSPNKAPSFLSMRHILKGNNLCEIPAYKKEVSYLLFPTVVLGSMEVSFKLDRTLQSGRGTAALVKQDLDQPTLSHSLRTFRRLRKIAFIGIWPSRQKFYQTLSHAIKMNMSSSTIYLYYVSFPKSVVKSQKVHFMPQMKNRKVVVLFLRTTL